MDRVIQAHRPRRGIWLRRCRLALLLVGALAVAPFVAGCAKAQAEIEPDMPLLAVPPPPPRVLPPLEGEPIEAAAAVPSEPAARPREQPRPRTERSNGNTRQDTGSTAPAAETAPPPVPAEEPPQPAPALQLSPTGEVASEQATQRQLARAAQDLQRVDYRLLNTDGKEQYDTAKRYITLAHQAIADRNFLFARTLADKAATIAAILQRR